MGSKIIVVLFCVFILGLVIYAVNSNILGKLGSPLGSLFHYNPASLFSITSSTISSAPLAPEEVLPPATGSGSEESSGATTTISPSEIPTGFTLGELSPYFQKITFGEVYPGNSYSYGTISLSAYGLSASDTVDITGWQIKTNRGGEYIPQAINLYDPSGLTAPTDIFLQQGQYVNIYSSRGPFNLRLNECIGWIGNSNILTPALPTNCPTANQSAISDMGLTGACEEYIDTLGPCEEPNLNNLQIPQSDYACRDYLENNFNYKACFLAHDSDTNFLSNQWWVWMGSSPLDPYHDTVNLFDKNGLLVAQYSY